MIKFGMDTLISCSSCRCYCLVVVIVWLLLVGCYCLVVIGFWDVFLTDNEIIHIEQIYSQTHLQI
jgi:hypothetical protein